MSIFLQQELDMKAIRNFMISIKNEQTTLSIIGEDVLKRLQKNILSSWRTQITYRLRLFSRLRKGNIEIAFDSVQDSYEEQEF